MTNTLAARHHEAQHLARLERHVEEKAQNVTLALDGLTRAQLQFRKLPNAGNWNKQEVAALFYQQVFQQHEQAETNLRQFKRELGLI